MVKKFLMMLVCLITIIVSSISCGNQNLGLGNFEFRCAHISVGGKETCVKISSWHDNELGCEIKLENGNVMYLSEGTYILMKDEGCCPLCNLNK